MFKTTDTLQKYLSYYNVNNLSHGAKEDKLGDAFEDYCVDIWSSENLLEKSKSNTLDLTNTDDYVFFEMISAHGMPPIECIKKIDATKHIDTRETGGNPKTDVILTMIFNDNSTIQIPISIKQTSASKVAMAEFDVDTIVNEVGINDSTVIRLMRKHQEDASAKNFTADEKNTLKSKLIPFADNLVRWVVAGSPKRCGDIRFANYLMKFQISKNLDILEINFYDVDDYVKLLRYYSNGVMKTGGFGTGLSWTYATGSKGKKIQFKG